MTSSRGLAACLATLGVPFKNPVPITNEYSDTNPVPSVPCGHPRWRPGKVQWHFEDRSNEWTSGGNPVTPKTLTKAFHAPLKDLESEFHSAALAGSLEAKFKALDDALNAGNINGVGTAWLAIKNDMPFVLAGYIGIALRNYLMIWLPMLKKGWTQLSIASGEGQCNLSTNPSESVKKALL